MAIDEAEDLRLGLKRKDNSKQKKSFKSVAEAYQSLLEKGTQKAFKESALKQYKKVKKQAQLRKAFGSFAPIVEEARFQANQAQISQKREGVIRAIGSRAEQMERKICSFNEVPLLRNMESARAEICSPPNKWLNNVEKSITDSFPD